jgi:hypothetical protein
LDGAARAPRRAAPFARHRGHPDRALDGPDDDEPERVGLHEVGVVGAPEVGRFSSPRGPTPSCSPTSTTR